ncbi:uncharacterized protein BX664DRAFT_318427 [Halteromyces radiatus]|uniref:uncharacterized protein n=1 Tax=Halteromyces radiatus TaxID=101107 RepID=UPI00222070EC|nr:uncharacterized protein BX664DRAFT_318427 [Halteromyces radiatus]KAI8077849.1 hypothetical protein BX664DRAFT_318427 [Halteromyces radiatus]
MMLSSSTCTLPPISDLFALPRRASSDYPSMNGDYCEDNDDHSYHHHRTTSATSSSTTGSMNSTSRTHHPTSPPNKMSSYYPPLKAKRKRASPSQLSVLNRVFSQTYFPSTELRIELGKHLGMSPRTVQIWFQNKRQSLRSRTRRLSLSSMENGDDEDDYMAYPHRFQYDANSPPHTPTEPKQQMYHHHQEHCYHDNRNNEYHHPLILPPVPNDSPTSSSPTSPITPSSPMAMMDHDPYFQHKHKINLPPLRLHHQQQYPPSPPSSAYPSPISIDSILQ